MKVTPCRESGAWFTKKLSVSFLSADSFDAFLKLSVKIRSADPSAFSRELPLRFSQILQHALQKRIASFAFGADENRVNTLASGPFCAVHSTS